MSLRGARSERKAKIAFWAGSFERAGTQRFLVELVKRIDRSRFEPIILTIAKQGELLEELAAADVPVHEFQTGRTALSPRTIAGLSAATAFLLRERIDVLSPMVGITTLFGPLVGRAAGVPVVVNNQRNLGYWVNGRAETATFGFVNRTVVDAVLVNSRAAAAELVERFSVPRSKLVLVGSGTDLPAIDSAEPNRSVVDELGLDGRPVVGIVAKLSAVKGHEQFIRAAALLARERDDMVGDGPRRQELERIVADLGLTGRVHFLGVRTDVLSLLKIMDVLALTSLSEGSPNVILEAMGAGLPVVATRVGGIPELVEEGRTGLLVEPGDDEDLAGAIAELVDHPERARAMGVRGRVRVTEQFQLDDVVRRFEDTFTTLLRAVRSGRGAAVRREIAPLLERRWNAERQA